MGLQSFAYLLIYLALHHLETNLFFTYDKFSTAVLDQKRCNGRLLLTGKRWVVRYTIYPFSTATPFTTALLPNQDLIGPKKKTHEN